MATINFLIKGKDSPATIYLRFKHGRTIDFTKSTGFLINPTDWNINKKKPKPKDEKLKHLNTTLNDLSNHILKCFNNSKIDEVNSSWIKYQIDFFKGEVTPDNEYSDIIIHCIQKIIDTANTRENSKGKLGLSKSRINSYKNLKNIFLEFQNRKTFRVKDVDIKFGKHFLDYLINEKEYSESYSRKKIDDLKTVCNEAFIYGVEISPQLGRVKGGKPKGDIPIILNRDELRQIEDTELTTQSLQNARKWLLFGCNIGQRGGDLLKITESNFINREGLEYIEIIQQKTGKQIAIPILEDTRKILFDGMPKPISIQKFNEYIKAICRQAGIKMIITGKKFDSKKRRKIIGKYPKWQLISSHVCRRSFATNLYGYLPTPLIMQITGHSTEKMFLQYIGKSSLDYAQQIKDFYQKQTTQNPSTPVLRLIKKSSGNE